MSNINNLMCTTQHQQQFIENIGKGMITGNVPFTFVENEFIMKAAAVFDVKMPRAKTVAGPLLDRILADQQLLSAEAMSGADYVCGTSNVEELATN
jgi:hypothetical protein